MIEKIVCGGFETNTYIISNEGKCIISIYYTNSPSDIEKISKQENIGIDKRYKDNETTGFNDRIIVKKWLSEKDRKWIF